MLRSTWIIFSRELAAYLRSPVGWLVAAAVLLVDGILFQSKALGDGARMSAQVLAQFFYLTSGVTTVGAVVLSVRLLAEERQNATLVLLNTSPVSDVNIVVGKFMAALVFLSGITLASVYMPLLILVNGKVSLAQIVVGYVGLLLLGGAVLAIGMFASALTRSQLLAAALGAAMVITMFLLWPLSKVVSPPLNTILAATAIHARHFQGFQSGVLHVRDVVYYLAVIYFFLLLSVKVMEAKRWQ